MSNNKNNTDKIITTRLISKKGAKSKIYIGKSIPDGILPNYQPMTLPYFIKTEREEEHIEPIWPPRYNRFKDPETVGDCKFND